MKYSELNELITKMYPLNPYELIFDQACISRIAFAFVEGHKKSAVNMVYYRVLVSVKNFDSFYLEIEEYPITLTCDQALSYLNESDIYIPEHDLQSLRNADVLRNLYRPDHGRDAILDRISEYSKKTSEEILKLAGLPN